MLSIIRNESSNDYSLVATALESGNVDKAVLESAKRLRSLADYRSFRSFDYERIGLLCDALDLRITRAALSCALFFRESMRLAVISGAGIAGLAASFELRARGYKVVIAEKRGNFSRWNVINLSIETQVFLKRFNLLEKFENYVGARIKEHKYVVITKSKEALCLSISDVSGLELDESISFGPENYGKLFDQDGIYSVQIQTLQTFLAESALEAGVNIFGNVSVDILARTRAGGVSRVQIGEGFVLEPNVFFIAEGAHSMTASQLGIKSKEVRSTCTGESWIIGNMTYFGEETFVVSVIDTSEKTLRLANVIFNAKSHVINVAVTSTACAGQEGMQESILNVAQQVFDQESLALEKVESTLLTTVAEPVCIINRISSPFSRGNVFCIGDSAGSSSPLAGLGGTLGLTLVPYTIGRLIDDYEQQSRYMHKHFNVASKAYTARWIQKSEQVKRLCLGTFEKQSRQ